MLGRVPASDLPGLYQHAWAFVFPSIAEGFGLPVLEAMAAGTPVIHSDHPALLETVAGAGLPFPTADVSGLASSLLRLRDSTALQGELRERGRRRAASMPWRCWGEQVSSVLDQF